MKLFEMFLIFKNFNKFILGEGYLAKIYDKLKKKPKNKYFYVNLNWEGDFKAIIE